MEEPFQLPPAQASGGATIESLASGGVQVVGCAGLGAPVVLSPEEAALFRALFLVADGDGGGLLSPGESRAFLRRCLASEPAVARCHALAAAATAGGDDAAVGEAGWYVACRLCALAAAGVDLAGDDALPLVADGLREWAPPDFGDPPSRPGAGGGSIVKVMSPQLVGEGLQQFTQYAVRTRSTCAHYGRSEMRVLRRFSDFEWCRERLRRSRPGVVVPPLLSPKRWANNTSHDFVRERMESLTRFANRVVAHPKLRGSLEVQALLDASPAGLAAARALLDGAYARGRRVYGDARPARLDVALSRFPALAAALEFVAPNAGLANLSRCVASPTKSELRQRAALTTDAVARAAVLAGGGEALDAETVLAEFRFAVDAMKRRGDDEATTARHLEDPRAFDDVARYALAACALLRTKSDGLSDADRATRLELYRHTTAPSAPSVVDLRELDALLKKHDVALDPGLWPAYQKRRLAAARARRRTFAGAAAVVALVGLVAHAGRA